MARRCFELDQRIADLDRQAAQRSHETVKAVSSELSLIGAVIRDLAEAVAMHDAELFSQAEQPRQRAAAAEGAKPARAAPPVEPPGERVVPNAPTPRQAARPAAAAAAAPVEPTPAPAVAPEPPAPSPAPAAPPEASMAVRKALVSGGVDLFLHSVVSLPQRKVRLYEALGRVREADGSFAEADAVAAAAARLGLTTKLETDLFSSVCKVASHLAARERDVPVMCP